jgi:hypothetical protein
MTTVDVESPLPLSLDDKKVPRNEKAGVALDDKKVLRDEKAEDGLGVESEDQIVTNGTASTDNPFFVRSLEYSREEEAKVIRILDTRLFPCVLTSTFVLNVDRTNHSNAISDNLPEDLGFTIDAVNTGLIIYAIFFSVFTLSGSIIAKRVGPSRWLPILMFAWALVTLSHALIQNRRVVPGTYHDPLLKMQ